MHGVLTPIGASPIALPGGPLFEMAAAEWTRAYEAANWDPRTATFDTSSPWLGDGVARVLSGGAVLIEAARTNYITESSNLNAWTAINSPTVAVCATPAPDGSAAYEVTDDGILTETIALTTPNLNAGTHSLYAFVEKRNTSGVAAALYAQNGTGTISGGAVDLRIDPADGSFNSAGSEASADVRDAGNWWLLQCKLNIALAGAIEVRLYPARGPSLVTTGGAATATVGFWGAQLEEGEFPTSPVRTSGGAATRAVEYGRIAAPGAMLGASWSYDWWPLGDSDELASTTHFSFDESAGRWLQNRVFWVAGAPDEMRATKDGTGQTAATTTTTFSRLQSLTHTVRPAAGELVLSGTTTGGEDDGTGAPWAWLAGDLQVGGYSGGNQVPCGVFSPPRAA